MRAREVCGRDEPSAVERNVPLKTVACDPCWRAATFPEREVAALPIVDIIEQLDEGPVPDVGAGGATDCRDCGARARWDRTRHGRWMLLEEGVYPTHQVPIGKRWRVAGDGAAVNLANSNPTDTCRISHWDVCPSRAQPADAPLLRAVWNHNAGDGPHLAHGEVPPRRVPCRGPM